MAGCPDFLRGIVRIMWFGRHIILKHPEVGRRLQCLNCGTIGHPMARCGYTEAQLLGLGSRISTDREVEGLEDLATPFGSLAEIKETAAVRLRLQQEHVKKAQAVVEPSMIVEVSSTAPTPTSPGLSTLPLLVDGQRTEPTPKTKWGTVPIRRVRRFNLVPKAILLVLKWFHPFMRD